MQTSFFSTSDPQTRSIDTGTLFILAAILCSVGYTYLQQAVWQGISASFDFNVYHHASRLIRQGQFHLLYDYDYYNSNHAVGMYLYLPFSAIVLYPLSFFSFEQARIIWMAFNQCLLILSIFFVVNGLKIRDLRIILGIIILFLGFGPMHANMWWGNMDLVTMFCILASWWAYKQNRFWLCGVAIGLGTVIKITPAILGVYYLYKRAYGIVFWSIGTFVACVLFTIVVLGGFDPYYAWYTEVLPYLQSGAGKRDSVINQAFLALYVRLSQNGFFSESVASTLHSISALSVFLLSFALCRFKRLTANAPEFDMEFACITCLTVLIPERIGPANCLFVFPAYFITLFYLMNYSNRSITLLSGFGISYMLVSLGAFGSEAFSRWPLVLFQSSKLFGILILFSIIIFFLVRLRRDTEETAGIPLNQS